MFSQHKSEDISAIFEAGRNMSTEAPFYGSRAPNDSYC